MNPYDGPLHPAPMPDPSKTAASAAGSAAPAPADPIANSPGLAALRSEAARFALLLRLAPALRHEAAAPLQPIAMAASVLERRLAADAPDLAPIRDSAVRLVAYARAAAQGGLDLVSWLAPDRAAQLPLATVVEQTLALLATPMGFEGFTLVSRIEQAPGARPVPAAGLRLVLPGCLLWLSDQAPAGGTLCLETQAHALTLHLAAASESGNEKAGSHREPAYRRLGWSDIQALALGEGLDLKREGNVLVLTLPDLP